MVFSNYFVTQWSPFIFLSKCEVLSPVYYFSYTLENLINGGIILVYMNSLIQEFFIDPPNTYILYTALDSENIAV